MSEKPASNPRSSVCPLDCPDRCSLDVTVLEGRIASIGGSRRNPLTGGFICSKVARFARRLYGPERLLYPMRRAGAKGEGKFERITWDAALAEIASRFRAIAGAHGAEAILPFAYGGSNGLLTHGFVDEYFFRRLGAARTLRTLCAASTTAASEALYGRMPGTAFEDYAEARFVLVWGANPRASNIHLVPHLKEARRRGARVAAVDPRRMLGGGLADLVLQPFPGTDVAVALAMIHHWDRTGQADRVFLRSHAAGWERLFEEASRFPLDRAARIARVKPEEIARLADAYAASAPAVLRCGWGLERNRNGLAAVSAVLALPAVAGKFGVRGGGYTMSNSRAYGVDEAALAGLPARATRAVNMNRLGRCLTGEDPPAVRALYVYNCNPAATVPDHNRVLRGLRREDLFTVVFDQVVTDTALHADILLPATTFLEHAELSRSYGAYALQFAEPAVEAAGEARCNAEVFQALGRAMGWEDEVFSAAPEDLLRRAAACVHGPLERPPAPESLHASRALFFDFPGRAPVQFQSVFPQTPDGKIALWNTALGENPYRFLEDPGTPEHPLALISPASGRSISSTLAEFNLLDAHLEMNPEDAAARGLADGDRVRVFNALGEVVCPLRLDARIRPGVVSLPKGIWRRATLNGAVGNALVPDEITPVSGGACYNDARVQVAPWGDADLRSAAVGRNQPA